MNKILEYIKLAEKHFPGNNQKIKRYESELILSEILNLNRIDLYTKPNIEISSNNKLRIESLFKRRINEEPVQYLLGYTYFRNLKLLVNSNVLIPRPETELLVDKAIKILKDAITPTIIDTGTGSGAIALSIAHELLQAKIIAVDISKNALETAKKNSVLNDIKNVTFIHDFLCDSFKRNTADLITANLPYVTEEEYSNLENCVKKHEPKLALHGGTDGLDLIRILIKQSISVLKKNGWILLEIGFTQGKKTADLLNETDCFKNIKIIKDYNSMDRIVIAQRVYLVNPN